MHLHFSVTMQVSAELNPLNDKKLAVQFKTFKLFNGLFSIGAPEAAKGEFLHISLIWFRCMASTAMLSGS